MNPQARRPDLAASSVRHRTDTSSTAAQDGLWARRRVGRPFLESPALLKKSRSTCLAIQSASNEEEVVSAVREYIATLSPAQVALMPAGLIGFAQNHAEEVVQSALQLVNHEMLSVLNATETELIREAVEVFSTAATRLAALAALKIYVPSGGIPPISPSA